MPFTISHPALVLPLKWLWPHRFSLTGLMAGAMSPDLLYFLLADTHNRGFSHSWPGLLVFCIPAGVIFSFVFHRLFKHCAIGNLPWFLERRLSGLADSAFNIRTMSDWITLVGSVFLGALSHFCWDSFTHPDGEMVRLMPFLLEPVQVGSFSRPLCRWIQHLSTVLGGLTVIGYVLSARTMPAPTRHRPQRTPAQKTMFWIGAGLSSAAATFVMVWFYSDWYGWELARRRNLSPALSTIGLASWAGVFYFVCAYHLIRSRLVRSFAARRRSD